MSTTSELGNVWDSLLRAVGTDPRPIREITGASGVTHRLLGLGVDDKSGRVVLVTDEPTPRHAAMMQVDVGQTLSSGKVSVVRIVPFDLQETAKRLIAQFGGLGGTWRKIQAVQQEAEKYPDRSARATFDAIGGLEVMGKSMDLLMKVPIGKVNAIIQFIEQMKLIEIAAAANASEAWSPDRLSIERLAATDIIAPDRSVGVCPIVLPNFEESELEVLQLSRLEEAQELLKAKQIYQYFFPPADNLALGLIDRGASTEQSLIRLSREAPEIGHPIGQNELIRPESDPVAVIEGLKDKGMTVEGELGWELTPAGRTFRGSIKFKPSEGIVSKLLNRLNVTLSLDNLK